MIGSIAAIANVVSNISDIADKVGDLDKSFKDKIGDIFDMATAPGGPGLDAVIDAFADAFQESMVGSILDKIEGRSDEIPTAQMDIIKDKLENLLGESEGSSESIQEILDMIKEEIDEMAQATADEVSDEAAASSGGEAGGSNGAGGKDGEVGNWLVMLAKAMSSLAGEQLGQLIDKQEKLSKLEGSMASKSKEEKDKGGSALGAQAEEMTKLTGEIQAHTHMFKMLQEAMNTAIKSIGEALSATVRKQ